MLSDSLCFSSTSNWACLEGRLQVNVLSYLDLKDLMRVRTCVKSLRDLIASHFKLALACNTQRQLNCLVEQAMAILHHEQGEFAPQKPQQAQQTTQPHRHVVAYRNDNTELLQVLKDVQSTLCQYHLTLDSHHSSSSLSSSSPLFSSDSCRSTSSSSSSPYIHSHRCPYLSAVEVLPNLSLLLSSFSALLLDTLTTLRAARGNQRMFEEVCRLMVIVVRREHDEIMKIFFNSNLDLLTTPTLLIQDTQGRRFWETTFGFRNVVPYKEVEQILLRLWSSTSEVPARMSLEKLSYALSFFLNFPRNNLVTTHKWDRFLSHWGPFSVLPANLDKFVLSGGFVGLMTGVQAGKLLLSFQEEFVLIRYSHTSIRTLSISYVENQKIIHERKPMSVDLPSFLRAILQKKKLFPLSLVWKKVHQLKTLEDFSRNPFLLRQVMSDTWA